MRFHILSDLHLEFADLEPPQTDADVVVLAGDVHVGDRAVDWIARHFSDKCVVYVAGNHEYYGEAIPKHTLALRERCAVHGIHFLENESLSLGSVKILGCTLWTDYELFGDPKIAGFEATQRMTDYRKIRVSPSFRKLRSIDTAGIHYRSRRWLEAELAQLSGETRIVVTHHAPSAQSIPERYRDDILSAAYASRIDSLIETSQPALWVHGHMHDSIDYQIGNSRIVCNPRGYIDELNPAFDAGLTIEV